jgi:hypothetical protein
VTVFEGKYHQVKRMFAARGRHVTALQRIRIGALRLDPALPPGRLQGPACRGAGAGFPAGIRFVKMTKISSSFSYFRGCFSPAPCQKQQKIFHFCS